MHQCVHPTCIPHRQEPISAVLGCRYLSVVHSCKIPPMSHPSDLGTTYPGCLQCISDQQQPLSLQLHFQAYQIMSS
uniref:Uncharacterized protein n=1 Tax=Arundo donax TaxID=35708 RepID=A0A0A9G0U3_ARUDO